MPVGATEDPHALLPGQVYGRYRIVSSLQKGGMGEVVLAEDLESSPSGRRVVIKRLLEDFVDDETYLQMFREEARITSRLEHHNIVQVLDTPILQGNMCLALEFVPGKNLVQLMRAEKARGTKTPRHFAVHIMEQALRGLHYAHTAVDDDGTPLELVHRDVSPGNILASFEGKVKITDFGIAKSSASVASTTVGMVRGTTRYLSPEQIRAGKVNLQSDLFACAVILVEMLTGESLFDRGAIPPTLLAIVRGQRPPVAEVLGLEMPTLNAVLGSALSTQPELRPSSAAEFADVLLGAGHELGEPVSPLDLGRYLLELFPDSAASRAGSSGAHGATYLVEVGDPQQIVVGAPLRPPRSGAQPLNADEFESATGEAPAPARATPSQRRVSLTVPVNSSDIEWEQTDPHRAAVDLMDEVSDAQRELSEAERRLIRAGPIDVEGRGPTEDVDPMSESQAVADAFEKTGNLDPPRARWPLFVAGIAVGAAGMAFVWFSKDPPRPGVVDLPPPARVSTTRAQATDEQPVVPVVSATVAEQVKETDEEAATESSTTVSGYVTVKKPKGARVYVDGVRLSKRVPIVKFPVQPGLRKVVIKRRKFRRVIEVAVDKNQHLDLSRERIVTLEEK